MREEMSVSHGRQDSLARFLRQLRKDGIDIAQCCVVSEGVFAAAYNLIRWRNLVAQRV
jgi:hypothetical protein